MFVIPDEVLNKLICSVCSKYLSVKPVKIYGKGIIKCGRCPHEKDDGVVSLYENVIVNGLFPCINRYEGCKQLLAISEVAAHEKKCFSGTYSCPTCLAASKYSSLHLLEHFKQIHPSEIIKKAEVVIDGEKEYDNYYLYRQKDTVFILNIKCNVAENCFLVNTACLGPPERVHRILQYVKCYLGDLLIYRTKKRGCTTFDNNSERFKIPFPKNLTTLLLKFGFDESALNIFNYTESTTSSIVKTESTATEIVGLQNEYPKIYLSAEYRQQYPNHSLSSCGTKVIIDSKHEFPRICEFCENIFQVSNTTNIYKCSCNHVYCSLCFLLEPSCNKSLIADLKWAKYESTIYRLLYFYCRWNCGRFYCGSDLRYHEDHCKENTDAQDTPSALALKHFNFYLSNAKSHFVSRSNIFSFKDFNFLNTLKIFVITRDYFKFVLNSSFENKMFHFWVSHDYPADKFYVLFRIREKYKFDYFRVNTFSIDSSQSNVVGFAVLLRKIT